MSNEINLLFNKKQAKNSQLAFRVKILRFFALGMLCLVSLFSVVLFLLVLGSPLPSIKKQQDSLIESLASSHDVILQQTLVTSKLSEIDKIIKNRSDYTNLIKEVEDGMPKDATINQITFKGKIINITFTANNLDEITKYLDVLRTKVKNKKSFANVYVLNITTSFDNSYSVKSFFSELYITLL